VDGDTTQGLNISFCVQYINIGTGGDEANSSFSVTGPAARRNHPYVLDWCTREGRQSARWL
jgi:hypothetical protein